MEKLVIISASVRNQRYSHRAALYFQRYIEANQSAVVEILDLNAYQFPIFEERLGFLKEPSPAIIDFAAKVKEATGVIIVTPEYNGGYPASLKNVIDLLYDEWKKKPVALVTASAGPFGGAQVMTSLLFTLWKIGAIMVPAMFPIPKIQEVFDGEGRALDAARIDKRAHTFLKELLWYAEAKKRMESES